MMKSPSSTKSAMLPAVPPKIPSVVQNGWLSKKVTPTTLVPLGTTKMAVSWLKLLKREESKPTTLSVLFLDFHSHKKVSTKHGTGRCAVLVKDRERSLIADLAAANDYSHDHYLADDLQAVVKSCGIFYSAGFFLTVSPQTVVEIGKHCAAENKVCNPRVA
jgi:hypothetical protein